MTKYLIHGGGMDSTLMLAIVLIEEKKSPKREPIVLVHIDYGQLAAPFERTAVIEQVKWAENSGLDVSVVHLDTTHIQ